MIRRAMRWIKKDSRAVVLLLSVFGMLLPLGALVLWHFGVVWIDYVAPLMLLSFVLSGAFLIGWLVSLGAVRRAAARLGFLAAHFWYITLALVLALGAGAGLLLVKVCNPKLIHPLHVYDYLGMFTILGFIWLIGCVISLVRGLK